MAQKSSSNRILILVIVLAIALIAVYYFSQSAKDQTELKSDKKDLKTETGRNMSGLIGQTVFCTSPIR